MANKHYKIAVLSGKGGTGKTLVSVNMASIASYSMYIDWMLKSLMVTCFLSL